MATADEQKQGQAKTCDAASYTVVEDRPVVKERTSYILKHHPVEKQYVVETRFVGERELGDAPPDEVLGMSERIVKSAESSDVCDGAQGSAAAVAADASGASTTAGAVAGKGGSAIDEPVVVEEEIVFEEVVAPAAAAEA